MSLWVFYCFFCRIRKRSENMIQVIISFPFFIPHVTTCLTFLNLFLVWRCLFGVYLFWRKQSILVFANNIFPLSIGWKTTQEESMSNPSQVVPVMARPPVIVIDRPVIPPSRLPFPGSGERLLVIPARRLRPVRHSLSIFVAAAVASVSLLESTMFFTCNLVSIIRVWTSEKRRCSISASIALQKGYGRDHQQTCLNVKKWHKFSTEGQLSY